MKKMIVWGLAMLLVGSGLAQNRKTPLSTLMDMAARNDGKAQMVLAKHFVDGDSIAPNSFMALYWYAHAWNNGEGKRIEKEFKRMAKDKKKKQHYGFMRVVDGFVLSNIHQDSCQAMKMFDDGYRVAQHDDCMVMKGTSAVYIAMNDSTIVEMTKEEKAKLKERLFATSSTIQGFAGMNMIEQKEDTIQGLALLEKSAAAGFIFAHQPLSHVYLFASQPYYDIEKAIYHLQEMERYHFYDACNWLAFCHKHGLGGLPKDESRIAELNEKYENRTDMTYAFLSWLSGEYWFAKKLYEI